MPIPETMAHFWLKANFDETSRLGAEINIQEGWHCENCAFGPECDEILGATTGGCCFFKSRV